MSGFIKEDENSIANGIPARQIGPETGSFGDAIMTRRGETSAGTNEAADSAPAPAAGLDALALPEGDGAESYVTAEDQSFAGYRRDTETGLPVTDEESVAQQIADGGDHYKHGKTLADDQHKHDR